MSVIPAIVAILAAVSAFRNEWGDGGRFLLAGLGAWLIGKSFNIAWQYARGVRRATSRALPLHIVLIATSYCTVIAIGTIDTIRNIPGDIPFTWKFPARFIAYTIGIFALRLISLHLSYERRTRANVENRFYRCVNCGSAWASEYCARCGAIQPGTKPKAE